MRYRTLGRTGLQVSELGYGAWGIGQSMWIGADDDESLRALEQIPPKTKEWPVIPGMRSLRNVERNVAVGDGRGLPPETVERRHAHRWERNFYAA